MAYLPNIPLATDPKNLSQPQIKDNFGEIKSVFSIDHETFAANNGEGKHKMSTYPAQAVAAPGLNELRVYANTGTSGNPELFFRRSAGNPVEMTTANRASQGYTMTPAGVLMKWGNATIASAAGGPFNFVWPAAVTDIPFSTQFWAIVQVGSDPGFVAKDVNAICYVTSVTNPLQVTYRVWRRNQFNTPGTDQQPFQIWVFAIGIP